MSFSAGVVAAVGVSCAVGSVAAILGLSWWLERRDQRDRSDQEAAMQAKSRETDPVDEERIANLEAGALIRNLQTILPDHADLDRARECWIKVDLAIAGYVGSSISSRDFGPRCSFDDEVLAIINAAAGPCDLWARLPEMNLDELHDALRYFVARVLFPRLRTDGDAATTFLPPGMLMAYQAIMTMPEDRLSRRQRNPMSVFGAKLDRGTISAINLRGYWRTITAVWSSDVYSLPTHKREYEYPTVKKDYEPGEYVILEDDPRFPNIMLFEELMQRVFKHVGALRPDEYTEIADDKLGGHQGALATRGYLRVLSTRATDLALVCFSRPAVTEVFWPESGRPEVEGILPWRLAKTHLVTFGLREVVNKRVFACVSGLSEGEKYCVIGEPEDSDSHARRFRSHFIGDVRRNLAPGMKDCPDDPDGEMPDYIREVQEELGWIKEGEPGLRENPETTSH